MNYIVLVLLVLGIMGVIGWWELIKHFKYELKFRESLLFSGVVLALTIACLINYSYLTVDSNFVMEICIGIAMYVLILLMLYYIVRAVRLKKYVPVKVMLGYILLGAVYFSIMWIVAARSIGRIDGWDVLGAMIICAIFWGAYMVALMIVNMVLYVVHAVRKDNVKVRNENYTFNKVSYLNVLMILVMIGGIFGVGYYNEMNYDKMMERQKEVVMTYLETEHPEYEFEVIEMRDSSDYCVLFCGTPVIENEIVNKTTNERFKVEVKKADLTIYYDELKREMKKVDSTV